MKKTSGKAVVLAIAGFDPSGGAGVLADIKTIAAFGCYGLAAVTGLTFQNTKGVSGSINQTAETVHRQIDPLFDDFDVVALKTGLLPTAEVVHVVAETVRTRKPLVVVVDPVLESTSGFRFVDDSAVEALKRELLPLCSLVTPNASEAQRLSGVEGGDASQKERAAEAILRLGAGAVLITGGDEGSGFSTDLLVDSEGSSLFSAERVRSTNTHGTGCALASAIACLLAQGQTLRESIPVAKRYVTRAINSAPGVGGGRGPLNHFPSGLSDGDV